VLSVVAVCLAMLMAFIDGTVVNLALPAIQRDLHADLADLQWVVDGYILALAAFLLLGGMLGDSYGRRRLFLVGVLVFAAGSLVCALAADSTILITGRAVQGLGAAMFMPGTLAILAHTFPDARQRAAVIGLWSAVSGLSLAVGPIIGGALVEAAGWQSIFWINMPVAVAVVAIGAVGVTEFVDPERRPLDAVGQGLAVLALLGLTVGLIEGGRAGWTSPLVLVLLIAGAVLLVAFVGWERRTAHPMLPLTMFRNRTFATCTALVLLVGFGLIGMFFFLSLFLQNVQGYDALPAGLRLLPAVAAVMLVAPWSGRLSARFGPRPFVAVGMTLVALSLLLFRLVEADTPYRSWWPLLLLLGAGVGLTQAPTTAAVVGSVPAARAGLASGTATASQQLGGVLGIAVLGTILADRFAAEFRSGSANLGLPEAVRERIADAATAATVPPVPGVDPAALSALADRSFVVGMHAALLVAGIAYLAGAIGAALLLRRQTEAAGDAAIGSASGADAEVRPDPAGT
jgi:DHA2 family methylenomycin A resistance protein-like MFS transporter